MNFSKNKFIFNTVKGEIFARALFSLILRWPYIFENLSLRNETSENRESKASQIRVGIKIENFKPRENKPFYTATSLFA